MPPRTTEAEFQAMLRRAGLRLTAEQAAGSHAVFGAVEAMQERIRTPLLTPEAEPAVTFAADRR